MSTPSSTPSRAVVIGVGNSFRRDDGVGPAVADRIAECGIPDVLVVTMTGEPTALLEAWRDAACAVVVDAATGNDSAPGRIRRCTVPDLVAAIPLSSHAVSLAQTYALGAALSRVPDKLVVFTVDAADTGYGSGMTAAVAAAVPDVVDAVLAELGRGPVNT